MASLDNTQRFVPLAMFVLPLIVVKLTAVFLGGSAPSGASAASNTGDAPAASPIAAPSISSGAWSAAQQAAAAHVRMLSSTHFGPTPMLHVERPESAIEPTLIVAEPTVAVPEIPRFTLFAVISTTAGDHAVIDSRPYKQGDTVFGTNWFVQVIDIDRSEVTLAEREGTRSTRIAVNRR